MEGKVMTTATEIKVRPENKEAVQKVKESIESSASVVFANYQGLSVQQITELRKDLSAVKTKMRVCKNTILRIALDDLGIVVPDDTFSNPTAVFTAEEDAAGAAKILVKFIKTTEKVASLKGGVLDKAAINVAAIEELAELPSRDTLLAKVVGALKSPITGFVVGLGSPIRGLVYTLQAVQDQKAETS
ncbi:50S ribosomal protein L10 [bacterium]|jgi:large subunit ribosomal protein L10|nr:50S ribosomal protein L10 [bacterium]